MQESGNMQGAQIHVSNHHDAQNEALMQQVLMRYEVPRFKEYVESNGINRHSLSNADWTDLHQHWIRNHASVEEKEMYGLTSRAMCLSLNLHASESQPSDMMRDDHPADTADVRRGHEPSQVAELCEVTEPTDGWQTFNEDMSLDVTVGSSSVRESSVPSERVLFGPESGLSE